MLESYIETLIAEATEIDFKADLEVKKPKSWLKSVSSFANGVGGILIFGVDDNKEIKGLSDIQKTSERITELIKEKIEPQPEIIMKPYKSKDGKEVLCVKVYSGMATPYYYSNDGNKVAFIRIGNQSVTAPPHILNELILKGQNRTFDSLISEYDSGDYSFTLLEATHRERTGDIMEKRDYISYGLVNQKGKLTNAGALFSDQCPIRNSRIFCTRWNGITKGSIFDDAIDDKEFSGSLIYLLDSATNFIKNNSRKSWRKTSNGRIEKPDYAERAVFEAVVNAIIHRDYLVQGSEVHIDMYDDRVSIWSPGGMFDGTTIQEHDIFNIESRRRNPIIADLFNRLRFMERRGSGLTRIVEETKKLVGFSKEYMPEFESTQSEFRTILKNVNYISGQDGGQDGGQDSGQDDDIKEILEFCSVARTRNEIQEFCGIKSRDYFRKKILNPLLENGKLKRTLPDKPNSKNQKYIKEE